jgi:hypothetical protein
MRAMAASSFFLSSAAMPSSAITVASSALFSFLGFFSEKAARKRTVSFSQKELTSWSRSFPPFLAVPSQKKKKKMRILFVFLFVAVSEAVNRHWLISEIFPRYGLNDEAETDYYQHMSIFSLDSEYLLPFCKINIIYFEFLKKKKKKKASKKKACYVQGGAGCGSVYRV